MYWLFAVVLALKPIQINGNRFTNGTTFIINGVAYQPTHGNGGYKDVISNEYEHFWLKDLQIMHELGINTLRVYEVDVTKAHDRFMIEAEKRGIYVLFDLPDHTFSLNRIDPVYTLDYLIYLQNKILALEFPNTLGFFVGNEVVNMHGNMTKVDEIVKAIVRDLKLFMSTRPRNIPLGYSAVDDNSFRAQELQYFTCGDKSTWVDFYALNVYSWCGNSNMKDSGYLLKLDNFRNLGIPVFFSEYGCNTVRPRMFSEVHYLFSPPMTDVFSGGIVYQYSEEVNQYGLVQLHDGSEPEILQDYKNLKQAISKLSPISVDPTPTDFSERSCPNVDEIWLATSNLPQLPTVEYCKCISNAQKCFNGTEISSGKQLDDLCGNVKKLEGDCLSILNALNAEKCNVATKVSIVQDWIARKTGKCTNEPDISKCSLTFEKTTSIATTMCFQFMLAAWVVFFVFYY